MNESLKDFWKEQKSGYDYLSKLPPLTRRLQIPRYASAAVNRVSSMGTLFVVSTPDCDTQDISIKRLGITSRYKDKPPIIWVNFARHQIAAKAASKLGFPSDYELTDTLFHEIAHATGHYLNRKPTAPASPPKDIEKEEAIAHGIVSFLWEQAGEAKMAEANMISSAKHALSNQPACKAKIKAAIQWLQEK